MATLQEICNAVVEDGFVNGTGAGRPKGLLFGGPAFDAARDGARLTKQIDCIRELVLDGEWRTVQKLTSALRKKHPLVGFPENSVQAQLRNLRKEGYAVERKRVGRGLWEYRVLKAEVCS